MTADPPFAEWFWGGYLQALAESGVVTLDTPRAEIEQMRAEFMAGLRGEASPLPVAPITDQYLKEHDE